MGVSSFWTMLRNRRNRERVYTKPDFWDAKAAEYEGDAISMWPNNALNRHYHAEQLKVLDAALGEVAGKTLLDLGCGTGRISRHLASRGAQVTGVDFSSRAVEVASRLSPGGNPRFRVQSVFDLHDESTFDAAVTFACLTVACATADDFARAVANISRAVRPGGTVLFIEPFQRGFLHRVLNMDVQGCAGVMQANKLRVKEIRQLHFWPARLGLAFVRWPAWLTDAGYFCGQSLMRLPVGRRMGDYKAVITTREQLAHVH